MGANITQLTRHIEEKLSEIGAFRLYVEWENILTSASKEFVREFSAHAGVGKDWSKETERLFYQLYKAYVQKNELPNEGDKFKCACQLMNRSFYDTLHNETDKNLRIPAGFSFSFGGSELTDVIKAKINTSLFLSTHDVARPNTGNVYMATNLRLKRMLLKTLFKGDPPSVAKLCQILVTPECDLAMNKTLMVKDGVRVQRTVSGIYYKMEKSSLKKEISRMHSGNFSFRIAPIWHNNAIYIFIIHFSTLSYISESELTKALLFSLKRDVIFDLQSKAANHVNRLGNYILE